jgi:hypothetical protein
MAASREVGRLSRIVRLSIGVRGDLEPAKAFLDALAVNPEAVLSDPGAPNIEYYDIPDDKPMPDGSQFFNRGPPVEEQQPAEEFHPNPATDPNGAWHHMHPSPFWGQTL